LLGHSEFAVRFFSPFTYALGSLVVFLTTREVYDQRSAFWAALSWLLLPSVSLSASVMSTDPFMLMMEALVLYSFVKAIKTEHLIYWISLGVFLGLSILSKYTALFFIISAFIYLFWSQRYLLTKPSIYLSVGICFIILWPNLLWNMHHHFLAIQHVSQHNLALNQASFHPFGLIKFWLAQMGMLGPFFLIALFFLIKERHTWKLEQSDKLFLSFILPLFITVSLEELLVHGYDNWAAGIYMPLIIWLSHYLVQTHRLNYLKWNLKFSLLMLVIVYGVELTLHLNSWQLYDRINPYKRQQGWHQTQAQMQALQQQYPHTNYLFDSRVNLFKSLFYLGLNPTDVYFWGNQQAAQNEYNLNTQLENAKGESFIFITNFPDQADLFKLFRSAKLIQVIKLPVSSDKNENLYWFLLVDYRG
ncbi:MAG TPA: glycosyltransferase family 39 protein, partial [Coxiellaceae bacterium]|nr:glycosyltransferase family 39 protein [Coxiellaceae bacterium]